MDDEYDLAIRPLKIFGPELERLIRRLLEAEGIEVHDVSHRVKERDSCERKLQKSAEPGRELHSLTDLLGLRIITLFSDQVDKVAKVIESEFSIDAARSVDKRTSLDPDRFGYLSLHYIATLSEARQSLIEYRSHSGIVFEIQIRSILQHAWAEIEHDLGYKSSVQLPRNMRRRFSRLAGLLEIADDEFERLQSDLTRYQAYATEKLLAGQVDIEINRDSTLAFIVSSPRFKRLDELIVAAVGGALRAPNTTYAGSRADELRRVGFASFKDIEAYAHTHWRHLAEFARRWISDDYPEAGDSLHSDEDFSETSRGVGLFYVFLFRITQLVSDGNGDAVEVLNAYGWSAVRLLSALRASEGDSASQASY